MVWFILHFRKFLRKFARASRNAESSGGKLASPAPFSCLRRCCAGRGTTRVPPSASESPSAAAQARGWHRREHVTSREVGPDKKILWKLDGLIHFVLAEIIFSWGKFPGNLRAFSSNKGPEISYQSAGISRLGQPETTRLTRTNSRKRPDCKKYPG